MQVNPVGLTLGPMAESEHTARSDLRIDDQRLDQLMRWHGTDETHLPPAHTLQNLSRDTIAALNELREAREAIEQLRAAMGRAFWATEFRTLHTILLEALGPPPEDDPGSGSA
jgi:hypothetical protein